MMKKDDQPANGVAEQHGRAGQLDDAGRAQEQARADGAAQRDELDMAVLEPALQMALRRRDCASRGCSGSQQGARRRRGWNTSVVFTAMSPRGVPVGMRGVVRPLLMGINYKKQ
jgi:hypothetical protein